MSLLIPNWQKSQSLQKANCFPQLPNGPSQSHRRSNEKRSQLESLIKLSFRRPKSRLPQLNPLMIPRNKLSRLHCAKKRKLKWSLPIQWWWSPSRATMKNPWQTSKLRRHPSALLPLQRRHTRCEARSSLASWRRQCSDRLGRRSLKTSTTRRPSTACPTTHRSRDGCQNMTTFTSGPTIRGTAESATSAIGT